MGDLARPCPVGGRGRAPSLRHRRGIAERCSKPLVVVEPFVALSALGEERAEDFDSLGGESRH